jgi:hypothetical protein
MRVDKTPVFVLALGAFLLQSCSPSQVAAIQTAVYQTQLAENIVKWTADAATLFAEGQATQDAYATKLALFLGPNGPHHARQTQQALETSFSGTMTAYVLEDAAENLRETLSAGGSLDEVFISVTADTNCRSGPAANYTALATVLVGEKVQVVAKFPGSDYVVVKLPDGSECWLWLRYATETDFSDKLLPIATQPHTPTPTYTPFPTKTPRPPTPTPTPTPTRRPIG